MRPQVSNDDEDFAYYAVKQRMKEILVKRGRGIYVTSHEIYGLLAEELNKELLDAIHNGSSKAVIKQELLDIACAAIWGVASINTKEMDWV